jgi:hypothetical protein
MTSATSSLRAMRPTRSRSVAPSWGAFWSASRWRRDRATQTEAWSVAQGVMARPQRAQGLLGQRRQA